MTLRMTTRPTMTIRAAATTWLKAAFPQAPASGSPQRPGAPYLARFSRDVGYHCSFPLTLDSSDALSGQPRWNPTSREKRARYGAPGLCGGTRGLTGVLV